MSFNTLKHIEVIVKNIKFHPMPNMSKYEFDTRNDRLMKFFKDGVKFYPEDICDKLSESGLRQRLITEFIFLFHMSDKYGDFDEVILDRTALRFFVNFEC